MSMPIRRELDLVERMLLSALKLSGSKNGCERHGDSLFVLLMVVHSRSWLSHSSPRYGGRGRLGAVIYHHIFLLT